jgi:hypothetical protein
VHARFRRQSRSARPVPGLQRLAGARDSSAACGGTPAGGDPGGRRLQELGKDSVFAAVPEGATATVVTRTPARYRKPGFGGGGWDGPSVVVTFESSAPPADVYGFYARRAAADGWRPTAKGALGFTDRWAKTYPDGAAATLYVALVSGREYRLSGAIAPVVKT